MRFRKAMSYSIPVFFFVIAIVTGYFINIPDALATGGAFKDTKHGGGVVDGMPFNGVDRGINPDYVFYYNDANPEAGRYRPGECNNCHELHASFGEAEPPPSSGSTEDPAGGPNHYLAFADPKPDLCWYCHESMSFNPMFGGGTGFWRFYQGKARYQGSAHFNSTVMKNPGYGPGSPWPRTDRTSNLSSGHCLNCHTPHGIKGSYDTGAAPSAANYSVSSTADNGLIPRQAIAREEALCLNCHDGSPTAKNIKEQVDKYITGGFGHPVRKDSYSGNHDLANEDPMLLMDGWLDAAPHAECTDCHNPHVAAKGPGDLDKAFSFQRSQVAYNTNRGGVNTASGPVRISNANKGVWGVDLNTATGAVFCCVDSLEPDMPNFVYQLCLKCHSSFGLGASTSISSSSAVAAGYTTSAKGDQTKLSNVAGEFATNNYGYHPVFNKGKNQPACGANGNWPNGGAAGQGDTGSGADASSGGCGLSNNFVAPWRHDSYVTCIDCHKAPNEGDTSTYALGPHGSANKWMLRGIDRTINFSYVGGGSYDYSTGDGTTIAVSATEKTFCFNCHRADIYGPLNQSVTPTKAYYARQPHIASFGGGHPWQEANLPKQGIHCMHCHGGGVAGGLHGSSWGKNPWGYGMAASAGSYSGRRLLNGATWVALTRGGTTAFGTCWTDGTVTKMSSCTQHTMGQNMTAYSTYDYESGSDP